MSMISKESFPEPISIRKTELDYIELHDYSISYYLNVGKIFRYNEPCLVYRDHGKFLEAVWKRINPDGSVNMGKWITEPIKIQSLDSSHLSKEEFDYKLKLLAQALFCYSICAGKVQQRVDEVAIYEGLTAQEVARFRDNPVFLARAVEIADEAQDWGRPYVILGGPEFSRILNGLLGGALYNHYKVTSSSENVGTVKKTRS